ncbi:MAG: hypothetical protein JWQ42_3647 [Edaphobacter sp.]|nr:hypothetical protein [Edaphobacter sp.]
MALISELKTCQFFEIFLWKRKAASFEAAFVFLAMQDRLGALAFG